MSDPAGSLEPTTVGRRCFRRVGPHLTSSVCWVRLGASAPRLPGPTEGTGLQTVSRKLRAATLVARLRRTWLLAASFKPSELPGLKQSAAGYTVKDLWNHTSLPGVQGKSDASITTDAIHAGDSRFYLVTPVAKSSHGLQ